MASSPKDKFDAAVKVIRGLPKNGSFQPSHELMLKFYSYYKQATEGPCTSSKPGFWDLVNRKKWEAWSNLGEMEPEEAMLLYVDELKKVSKHVREMYYPPQIVETMPQTEAVTQFLQKLDNFYEMVEDSENHNTLKIMDAPKINGTAPVNGSSEADAESETMNHSYNMTQLLKQGMNRMQDRSGVVMGRQAAEMATNGHSAGGRHLDSTGVNGGLESEEEERSGYDDEADDEGEENHYARGTNEEWEEVVDLKLPTSQAEPTNDSETENEEFCDTSDEPVEPLTSISSHSMVDCVSSLAKSANTSTPIGQGKSVHIYQLIPHSGETFADSLYVNRSSEGDHISELASLIQPGEATLLNSNNSLDISVCRGGEEQERWRQGQGSRGGAVSGDRTAQSGSGGGGVGSVSGGGGSGGGRGLFPGPGGGGGNRWTGPGQEMIVSDLNEQIVVTLLRLQHDMSDILTRLNSLEALVKQERDKKAKKAKGGWWSFPDLSVRSALIIILWPVFLQVIITYFSRRHRKLGR